MSSRRTIEILELRLLSVGNGGTDNDVVLPAVAFEQHRERSKQHVEQRRLIRPAEVMSLAAKSPGMVTLQMPAL